MSGIEPRPFTRDQALANRAFLKALRRTGNVRLAARQIGLKYGTVQYRRSRHAAFALAWDAALVFAQARLNEVGLKGPTAAKPPSSDGADGDAGRAGATSRTASLSASGSAFRTVGGEAVITRRNDGKLQMRAAQPNKLTKQCEQAFLSALSASANVRLSAAAAGASVAAFYRRRRNNPAFAREWRLALEQGYERLQMALLASTLPASHEDDAWRHNDTPEMPPMTVNQALQLLYLHQKEARLGGTPELLRRRPGESRDAMSMRLQLMHDHQMERQREAYEVAEAARRARGEPSLYESWLATADLAQVKAAMEAEADAKRQKRRARRAKKPAYDEGFKPASGFAPGDDRALFGGWRIEDMKKRG